MRNAKLLLANIIDGFIVDLVSGHVSNDQVMARGCGYHERTVRVLKCSMSCKNRVVRFYHGARELWGGVYTKFQLRFLSVVSGEPFEKEGTKARTSTATKRMEHEESLQTRTVVGEATNFVHDWINQLLSNGIVPTCICLKGR